MYSDDNNKYTTRTATNSQKDHSFYQIIIYDNNYILYTHTHKLTKINVNIIKLS